MSALKSILSFCGKWVAYLVWDLIVGSIAHQLSSGTAFEAPWWAWCLVMTAISISAYSGIKSKASLDLIAAADRRFDRVEGLINGIESRLKGS